ncbi:unnamed protein product, partial [marine sediment metagenome]
MPNRAEVLIELLTPLRPSVGAEVGVQAGDTSF